MARAATPLVEFAGDQVPLFADPERDYHWVAAYDAWERQDAAVTFVARDEEGRPLTVRLTFVEPAVLRVLLLTPGATEPAPPPFLVDRPPARVTLVIEERPDGLRLRTPALVVDIDRAPWRMRVTAAGRPLYRQEAEDFAFDTPAAFPFGYSTVAAGARPGAAPVAAHETFALAIDEHLYGLGGQYGRFDKRGARVVGWSRETYGTNTTPVTYMQVPFF
ncbi:MAG: alpha-glucosidase domain-containing protein, partial [Dehalococcoidia bacterium]